MDDEDDIIDQVLLGIDIEQVEMESTRQYSESLSTSFNDQPSIQGENTLSTSADAAGPSIQPAPSRNSILVNPRQRGNPVLKFIRNVPWEYAEVIPDYVVGQNICALFLSIRYHNLHPDYIHERLRDIKHSYSLRVLLVQIDVTDPYPILKSLTHIGMLTDLTIIPAYSPEEGGRILENYKIYENKPPDFIQEKQDPNSLQQVIDALTSIRAVNKTDAMILLQNFGSLEQIVKASVEKLGFCPGFGPHKAKKLYDALHVQFKRTGGTGESDVGQD